MKWSAHRKQCLVGALLLAVLVLALWLGGSPPSQTQGDPGTQSAAQQPEASKPAPQKPADAPGTPAVQPELEPQQAAEDDRTEKDVSSPQTPETEQSHPKEQSAQTLVPKSEKKKEPGKTTEPAVAQEAACTVSISCATVLANLDRCDPAKQAVVPEDGWLLPETTVTLSQGESVFSVLQRVCREKGIHMEYTNTPVYDSAYVEGIGNLYEFDVGDLSGWVYQVNGVFPNYGCSQYAVQAGDVIHWVYTCDQGRDVGVSDAG